MPGFRTRHALALPLLVAAQMAWSEAASAQGLFEFLFGPDQPAPSLSSPPSASPTLRMRVQPRKPARDPKTKRSADDRAKRMPKSASVSAKPRLAQPIDPRTNPDWYLKDPTLRRGDIVVLADGLLVFGGTKGRARIEDFASFRKSSLISKAEKARLQGIRIAAPTYPATAHTARQAAVGDDKPTTTFSSLGPGAEPR